MISAKRNSRRPTTGLPAIQLIPAAGSTRHKPDPGRSRIQRFTVLRVQEGLARPSRAGRFSLVASRATLLRVIARTARVTKLAAIAAAAWPYWPHFEIAIVVGSTAPSHRSVAMPTAATQSLQLDAPYSGIAQAVTSEVSVLARWLPGD